MQERVMVRLPDETIAILREMAAHQESDIGTVIRRLVHEQLEGMGLRSGHQAPTRINAGEEDELVPRSKANLGQPIYVRLPPEV